MSEPAEVMVILALMEATGRDEIRLTDEALRNVDSRTHLTTYRDEMRCEQVFRRVTEPEVIDGEEVAEIRELIAAGTPLDRIKPMTDGTYAYALPCLAEGGGA